MTDLTRRGLAALPATAALLVAADAGATKAAAESANGAAAAAAARFRALYEGEWAWREAQFPDDDDESKPFAPFLPDDGPAAQAARLARWSATQERLKTIDPAALSAEDRINYAVYKGQIDALAAAQRFGDYEAPFNSDSSFWGDMAFAAERSLRTEQNYRNYIARLSETPRWFDQQIVNMRAGLARGFTPPKATLAGRDQSVADIVRAASPEATEFYKPFTVFPESFSPALRTELSGAGARVIAEAVIPAHARLLAFLRETYLPGCRTTIAAEALPDGHAYYRSKIIEFTTLDLPPEEVHRTGLAETAAIRAEMDAVIAEVKFDGDFARFLAFLRSNPRFYVRTPQDLLDRAAWIAKTFDGKAKDFFGRLPRARFAIKPVPAAMAPFYTAGRGGPGVYLLNTYDLPSRPLYALTALTLHESAPGHAFQIPLALEQPGQPAFRRKGYISAYGEGWAVYCERLGEEMAMYDTPYDRFGMLSYQAWRSARLVVDTGIHAMGWSREKAQAYLAANTALSDHEIETEVDRYISWPAQALSYYLGEMAFRKARAEATAALGPKFDIRYFHDAMLQLGSVPLSVVAERARTFIESGGANPYPAEA